MKNLTFSKYQGAGNDFILINGINQSQAAELTENKIRQLCHRRFGIGADGLIILYPSALYDFDMAYFNADGRPGSLCGNGGRCAYRFAVDEGLVNGEAQFLASDGHHTALADSDGMVTLSMSNVTEINKLDVDTFTLNTGSPHFVKFEDDLINFDAFLEGKAIRNSPPYKAEGINVNFASPNGEEIDIQTYERGVEDLTYACGTGVTAVALVAMKFRNYTSPVHVRATGGLLKVSADLDDTGRFSNIKLTGPAEFVYKGQLG